MMSEEGVIELDFDLSMFDVEQYVERTAGLHLSTIYRDIMADLEPGRFKDDETKAEKEVRDSRWRMGMAFERALERALGVEVGWESGARWIRPGEYKLDGVILTPDVFDTQDWAVEEWKFTWMSSREAPHHRKFWHWWIQLMAYCKVMGTNIGRVRAGFPCGDYTYPIRPQFRSWQKEFTNRELDENWAMLQRHAKSKGWL